MSRPKSLTERLQWMADNLPGFQEELDLTRRLTPTRCAPPARSEARTAGAQRVAQITTAAALPPVGSGLGECIRRCLTCGGVVDLSTASCPACDVEAVEGERTSRRVVARPFYMAAHITAPAGYWFTCCGGRARTYYPELSFRHLWERRA